MRNDVCRGAVRPTCPNRRVAKGLLRGLGMVLFVWASALWADEMKPLTISVGDWPPFFVENEPGQGSVARLVRDVFADQGYDVTFDFLPWKRAYREAAIGKHSATAIWMHKEEREKDFIYSDAVMKERFVLFHRKDKPLTWDTMKDLSGLKLGASIGYSYGPEFDEALEQGVISVERASSTELNFKKLLYDRIDAFPEEINVGYYILRRETDKPDTNAITHHPKSISENESFLLFPRNDPDTKELLSAFNEGLKKFRESGQYTRYFDIRPQASLEKGSASAL
ncbi:transporter substrate-binding domain-containing protein [Marinobacter sp. CHS3-4]|uniref:substrate-binding periplasmic protein n=1 Tax=Marinobacter sp. CHS3-4 TaxID=3045174 RepID=UPI0024B62148|nr:transporter substrate-binding domain-containing protein [Marinobacter sp. CHS3-4]MDI9244773.1 transporter substrate-binding domain-containing protein [Marinobacter sp. CHS3-4]